jgi:ABC-type transporter Mla MlaB component
MTPGDTPTAGTDGNALDPVSQKRAIASKLRGVRKREFAMLRERMREGENTPNTVAGIRGRAVRDRPASSQTLEKIERIGVHLESLWNPGALKPAAPSPSANVAQPATPSATPTEVSPSQLAPNTWASTSLWSQPISQLLDPGPLSVLLNLPSSTPAPSAAPPAHASMYWIDDPVMKEIASLLALGKYPAVQTLLMSSLDPNSARSPSTYLQALILLDTYWLLGDMDGFDDAVLAYVHWWNGLTPSWEGTAPADTSSPWILQGDIRGANGVNLPELDHSETTQKIDIDCSALRHMDRPAVKALLQWLGRAKTRNYEVSLSAPSALMALLWSTMDIEKAAQVRKSF